MKESGDTFRFSSKKEYEAELVRMLRSNNESDHQEYDRLLDEYLNFSSNEIAD